MEEQKCTNIDFKKDSTYTKDLLNTAQDISIVNFTQALSQAKKGLKLAQTLSDNTLLFTAYRTMGIIYENNNRLTEAYPWYQKALALQAYLPTSSKLDVYLDWAIINKKLSKYEVTRDYYKHALELATKANDMEIVEYVYTGLGTLNGSISEFDKAIEYHLKSKEIAEKRQHTEGVIFANVNIATVYMQAKNYVLAQNFLQKGYDLVVSTPDSVRLDYVLNAYGQVSNAEKKYPDAIAYHQKALTYCEKTNDKWTTAITLSFMADVYTKMARYAEAEQAFKRCFEYSSSLDFYEQPKLYLALANLYLKTNRPNQAAKAFQKSLTMSLKRGFKNLVQKNYMGLTEVHEQMGHIDAALSYMQMAETYKDSIFNEDKSQKIAEVDYKYTTEKSEIADKINLEESQKDIQALHLSQNRTILYTVTVALFALFTFVFTFHYIKQKNRNNALLSQKNREIELKIERLEKSNEILKQFAYASAHDLKEPLRSISSFVSIINRRYAQLLPPEASEYMNFVIVGVKRMENLISALLEYSTIAADVEEVKEPASLSHVLNVVKINLANSASERNTDIKWVGYLPMIKISRAHLTVLFQNIISNAIKFNEKEPKIRITGSLKNDQYIVEIQDNGIGMNVVYSDKIFRLFQTLSRTAQYEGMGVGLAICKQIIEKYEGTICFESEEGVGTTFILTFPNSLIIGDKSLNDILKTTQPFNQKKAATNPQLVSA